MTPTSVPAVSTSARACSWRRFHPRNSPSSSPFTSTTTNETSGTPPRLASAGDREVVQRDADLAPGEAAEWPPSAQRLERDPRRRGDPRRAHAATTERTDDRAGAGPVRGLAATNGTIATAPKYTDHQSRTPKNATPLDEAVQRRPTGTRALPRPQQRDERDECEWSPVERGERAGEQETRGDRGEGAREQWFRAVRRGAHSQSRQRSFSPRASWLSGFTRKHDRQRNSSSRRGTTRAETSPLLVGLEVLVFEVVRLFLEPIRLRALVEQHVERLLDVVGVELLFEIDDVVVFLFGALLDRCSRAGYRYRDNIQGVLFFEKLIVDLDIDLRDQSTSTSRSSSSRSTSSSSSGSSSSRSSSSAITVFRGRPHRTSAGLGGGGRAL